MSSLIKMMGLILVLFCMSLFAFFIDLNNYQNINYENINYTTSRSFNNKKNVYSLIKTNRFYDLVLNNEFQTIENELMKINSIKNIEIYHNINLELQIDIIDRDPIAVLLELNSYMDSSGVIISTNNLVIDSLVQITGSIDKSKIPKILKTIKAFNYDKFFQNKLKSISFRDGDIYLNIRNYDIDIRLGNEHQLKNKLKMLKGFYAYQKNKTVSKEYKQIDLVYNNRLIAIKK